MCGFRCDVSFLNFIGLIRANFKGQEALSKAAQGYSFDCICSSSFSLILVYFEGSTQGSQRLSECPREYPREYPREAVGRPQRTNGVT